MDDKRQPYFSDNMDDDVQNNTLEEMDFQERRFGSQAEVIPTRKSYTSLWLFKETNPFRIRCRNIVESKVSFVI